MEVLKWSPENNDSIAARAAEVLANGGVIVYPTDTIYGLGADATNESAVSKIRTIKGSDDEKAYLCMVSSIEEMHSYADMSETAQALADSFLPGMLSLVLNRKGTQLAPSVAPVREAHLISLRIPNHELSLALSRYLGKPITSTSANVTGQPSGHTFDEVLAGLSEHHHLIDLAIDAGDAIRSLPSTIVDLSGDTPVIVREGAIPAQDILKALDL